MALGRAHDLLLQARWTSADLGTVVRGAIEAFDNPDDAQILDLGTRYPDNVGCRHRRRDDAQRTLHEHHEVWRPVGPGGARRHHLDAGPQTQRLHLAWTERNGPAVHPPEKRSFGTRLIETLGKQLKGDVQLTYASTGFIYAFDVPIASLTSSAA